MISVISVMISVTEVIYSTKLTFELWDVFIKKLISKTTKDGFSLLTTFRILFAKVVLSWYKSYTKCMKLWNTV